MFTRDISWWFYVLNNTQAASFLKHHSQTPTPFDWNFCSEIIGTSNDTNIHSTNLAISGRFFDILKEVRVGHTRLEGSWLKEAGRTGIQILDWELITTIHPALRLFFVGRTSSVAGLGGRISRAGKPNDIQLLWSKEFAQSHSPNISYGGQFEGKLFGISRLRLQLAQVPHSRLAKSHPKPTISRAPNNLSSFAVCWQYLSPVLNQRSLIQDSSKLPSTIPSLRRKGRFLQCGPKESWRYWRRHQELDQFSRYWVQALSSSHSAHQDHSTGL